MEDLNSGSNANQLEDACTQTTLRRPPKNNISRALSTQDVTATAPTSDVTVDGTAATQTGSLIELVACGSCSRLKPDVTSQQISHKLDTKSDVNTSTSRPDSLEQLCRGSEASDGNDSKNGVVGSDTVTFDSSNTILSSSNV